MKVSELAQQESTDIQELVNEVTQLIQQGADNGKAALQQALNDANVDADSARSILAASDAQVQSAIQSVKAALQPATDGGSADPTVSGGDTSSSPSTGDSGADTGTSTGDGSAADAPPDSGSTAGATGDDNLTSGADSQNG